MSKLDALFYIALLASFGIVALMLSTAPAEEELTRPTVIATVRGCDILRGVDRGHRYYYVADCRPDRLSQGEVMP